MNQLMILDFHGKVDFYSIFKSWKESTEAQNDSNYTANATSKIIISWQSYESIQIILQIILLYSSKKSVDFCYKKVSLLFSQKGFVRMILKIILVNNVLLAIDLIFQLYMILDIMTTQLRFNFWSDPSEEMREVLQKYLIKYVTNLCRNEENGRSLEKVIVALAVGRVKNYWL